MPATARLHHIAITVHSCATSVPWYEAVFGLAYRMDIPHDGGTGKLLTDDEQQLAVVLHEHEKTPDGSFDERVIGLDHIGFLVDGDDLPQWQAHLERNSVERVHRADRPLTQTPIAEEPYGKVLVFRDPDNIQLELFAPA